MIEALISIFKEFRGKTGVERIISIIYINSLNKKTSKFITDIPSTINSKVQSQIDVYGWNHMDLFIDTVKPTGLYYS